MLRLRVILIVSLLGALGACRSNPFGDTDKTIEEFQLYTTDFAAQNDGGMKSALLNVIEGSKVTLNCAFSALTLTDVTNAIIARARGGVQVKIAFDGDVRTNDPGSLALQASGAFAIVTVPLDGNQSQLLYGNTGAGVMRHNYCLADERYIYLSTAPPDATQMTTTPNVAVRIGTPQFGLARDFLRESNMFSQLLFGNGKAKTDFTTKFTARDQVIGAFWGPQESPLNVLAVELSEATSRVDFYSTAFLTTNSSNANLDVPQTLDRLEEAKGLPLRKYFSSQALFDSASKAYTLNNPAQYVNSNVRVGANIFVVDRGLSSAKTFIYTGSLRSQGNSSDDSVLIELRGRNVADMVAAYLDRIGAVSVVASNTGDTSANLAVVINEINYRGSYSDTQADDNEDNFLELYNTTNAPINLSNWRFGCTKDNGTTVNSAITLPPGAVIPAKGYFTIASKNSGAFSSATFIAGGLDIVDDSRQCILTNGIGAASGYAGILGTIIDTVGDHTTDFDATSIKFGKSDSNNRIRRNAERINPLLAGTSFTNWSTNPYAATDNALVSIGFRNRTFGSPGAANISAALNRPVYFTTDSTTTNGKVIIRVINPEANTNAGVAETVNVLLRSTADQSGISVTLQETGVNTAQFTSTAAGNDVTFSLVASGVNVLQVISGDTITLEYAVGLQTFQVAARWYQQNIVINEIGSNCRGVNENDYVEIYNPNAEVIDLTGIYLWRDSGCTLPMTAANAMALSGNIGATGYHLIGRLGYASSDLCPAPNKTSNDLGVGSNDCFALTTDQSVVSTAADENTIDFAGYGTAAVRETTPAPNVAGSTDQCISRVPNGSDSNNNSTDFVNQASRPCSPNAATGTLNVVSAAANLNANTLTVVFSGAANLAQAQTTANYCISLAAASTCSSSLLNITVASLSGATVTLTTAAQTQGTAYRIHVNGVTLDATGGALVNRSALFTGYIIPYNVVINEVLAAPPVGAAGDSNGDGAQSSTADEFIEIINNEAMSVDIGGWTVKTGAASPGTLQFTFPAGTTVAAGARVVVFGGGTPTGSFGGVQTFVASGLSLNNPAATDYYVTLENNFGTQASQVVYNNTNYVGSGSMVRSPEGSGGFVEHATVSGSVGIIWSPGVASASAIPKVNTALSNPAASATTVPVNSDITVQFNMHLNTADFTNTNLKLYASTCASLTSEITSFTSIGAGANNSIAILNPSSDLSYGATHCLVAGVGLRSGNNTPLASAVNYQFQTETLSSFQITSVVATGSGRVAVTYSQAPVPASAQNTGNYAITGGSGLTVSSAVLAGNIVTLSTTEQVLGQTYTLAVNNVTRNLDSAALAVNSGSFNSHLIPNSSYEVDTSSCSVVSRDGSNNVTAVSGTCPAGWTISISSANGITFGAFAGSTPSGGGNNFASLSSFTTSYAAREIRTTSCMPLNKLTPLNISGWYLKDTVNSTQIRHLVYYYTDSSCTVLASGGTNPTTLTGQSISAQNTWENKINQVLTGSYPSESTLYIKLGIQAQRASAGIIQFDFISLSN